MTLFQALYGTPLTTISMCLPGTTTIRAMDAALQGKDELMCSLKSHMSISHNRMKQHIDLHHSEYEFEIGDWVFLKLHPYQ